MKVITRRSGALTAIATLAAATATIGLGSTTAQAAARNGVCDSGEFCYSYNSGFTGSVSDFTASLGDYGTTTPSCYVFKGPGAGQGLCIKNAAAAVWNRTSQPVTVYYNSNYGGSSQTIAAGAKADLSSTLKNNNASHRIGATRTNLSYSTYKQSGGYLLCGFDGYGKGICGNIAGRHEGIDVKRGYGSPGYALVSGKVLNVARGSSSSLSTIAIYNATYDRTIIYLHSAPLSSLAAGQTIAVGQQLGTENYRGAGTQSNAHTHVEMRVGQKTLAAVSKNDYTLDNPDPTSFWNARTYNVK